MNKKTKNSKEKALTLPQIPISHLTIPQFEVLRESIKTITGYTLILAITDNKSKKLLGTL